MRTAWLLVTVLVPSIARAESAPWDTGIDAGPDCEYEAGDDAAPPSGDLPASWPRVDARVLYADDLSVMRLARVTDGSEVSAVPSATGLLLLEELVVGEEYDFFHPLCGVEPQHVTRYRSVEPVAPPSLGTIEVSPLYAANDIPGPAYRYYFVDVSLDPDPAIGVDPWTDVRWAPTTDGSASVTIELRDATFRAPVACNGRAGLPVDATSVHAVGGLTARRLPLETPPVAVTWSCDDALRVDPDTLRPLTPDEIVIWDTPAMDAGRPRRDGGARPDAGTVDGGRMDMHTEPDTDSSCAITPGAHPPPLCWALAVLLLAARRSSRSSHGGAERAPR